MSNLTAPEQDVEYAHCNGSIKENIKLVAEKNGGPNGIHVFPDKMQQKHMDVAQILEENEKIRPPETERDASSEVPNPGEEKSTNKLIDEFSMAMALSLIQSSESLGFGNARDSGARSKLKDNTNFSHETESNITDIGSNCDKDADSTRVEYPSSKTSSSENVVAERNGVKYLRYESERQMSAIMQLITKDLSEPYSIYTYRYFIHNWPHLCFLAMHESTYVGAIVCKLDLHKKITRRGYIAMLAVDQSVRRRSIGTNLVKMAIETMDQEGCDEVVLETEVTNKPALKLYENLGFVRDKRLFRYYLNGVDALRLKLWLR